MDKRIIYLIMCIGVVAPMFMTFGLPITVERPMQDFFNVIENLPPDSIVVVAHEASPSQISEFKPMLICLMTHIYQKGHRIVIQSFWAQGNALALEWSKSAFEANGMIYGTDYVCVGYRTGLTAIMDGARTNYINAYSDRDHYGNTLSTMPVMRGFEKASDIGLVVIFTGGSPGVGEYISNWQSRGDVMNMIACAAAVQIPPEMVRYQAGMLQGICGGMSGAAQYEKIMGMPGSATSGMDSQGIGHLTIILLVILGNIGYFIIRNAEAKERASRDAAVS